MMVAIENALATLDWSIQMPGIREGIDSEQTQSETSSGRQCGGIGSGGRDNGSKRMDCSDSGRQQQRRKNRSLDWK